MVIIVVWTYFQNDSHHSTWNAWKRGRMYNSRRKFIAFDTRQSFSVFRFDKKKKFVLRSEHKNSLPLPKYDSDKRFQNFVLEKKKRRDIRVRTLFILFVFLIKSCVNSTTIIWKKQRDKKNEMKVVHMVGKVIFPQLLRHMTHSNAKNVVNYSSTFPEFISPRFPPSHQLMFRIISHHRLHTTHDEIISTKDELFSFLALPGNERMK